MSFTHHKSHFWTSSVPNKLPTNPTSPEPVPNDISSEQAQVFQSSWFLNVRLDEGTHVCLPVRWRMSPFGCVQLDHRQAHGHGCGELSLFLFDSLQYAWLFCHTHSVVLSPRSVLFHSGTPSMILKNVKKNKKKRQGGCNALHREVAVGWAKPSLLQHHAGDTHTHTHSTHALDWSTETQPQWKPGDGV